jgi:dolichyl-phosphate-mannose-protein mannosyltransferase
VYYLRYLPVAGYRFLSPRGFDLWPPELNHLEALRTDLRARLAATRGYTVALKIPGILADAAIGAGVFAFLLRRAGSRTALWACAAYALNPAILFDTAFWGQHDAVAAGLVALSLYLVETDRVEAGGAAYVLAALTKPQAGAFAILFVALMLRRFPVRRVLKGALAGLGVAALLFLPFLLHGTFALSIEALVRSTFGGEPFVSCNANSVVAARGRRRLCASRHGAHCLGPHRA